MKMFLTGHFSQHYVTGWEHIGYLRRNLKNIDKLLDRTGAAGCFLFEHRDQRIY